MIRFFMELGEIYNIIFGTNTLILAKKCGSSL
jgi:hypothetical protein